MTTATPTEQPVLTPDLRARRAIAAATELQAALDYGSRDWVSPFVVSQCAQLYNRGGHVSLGLWLIRLGHERDDKSVINAYGKVVGVLWRYYPEIFPVAGSELASDRYDPVAHPEQDAGKGAGLETLRRTGLE